MKKPRVFLVFDETNPRASSVARQFTQLLKQFGWEIWQVGDAPPVAILQLFKYESCKKTLEERLRGRGIPLIKVWGKINDPFHLGVCQAFHELGVLQQEYYTLGEEDPSPAPDTEMVYTVSPEKMQGLTVLVQGDTVVDSNVHTVTAGKGSLGILQKRILQKLTPEVKALRLVNFHVNPGLNGGALRAFLLKDPRFQRVPLLLEPSSSVEEVKEFILSLKGETP